MLVRKKYCIMTLIAAVCMITSCSDNSTDNSVVLKDNQIMKYAVIDEINGNEINIRWVQRKEITAQDMDISKDKSRNEVQMDNVQMDNVQMDNMQYGQFPQNADMQGVPNMSNMPDVQHNSDMSDIREMSEADNKNLKDGSKNKDDENGHEDRVLYTYEAYGDEQVMLIPVGTDVYTMDNTKTTFSRLSANDVVELVLEEMEDGTEVIIEVRMVG